MSIIKFKDPDLANAIRNALDIKGKIRTEDVEHLNTLNVYKIGTNRCIYLDGIENLKNLQSLKLTNNYIADITPLKYLSELKVLNIENNNVKNSKPLKDLINLEVLCLRNNDIDIIESLKNLKNLKYLNISKNPIKDISIVSNLTNLEYLNFDFTHVIDINPIKYLTKLRLLGIPGNNNLDISILNSMTHVKELFVNTEQVYEECFNLFERIGKLKHIIKLNDEIVHINGLIWEMYSPDKWNLFTILEGDAEYDVYVSKENNIYVVHCIYDHVENITTVYDMNTQSLLDLLTNIFLRYGLHDIIDYFDMVGELKFDMLEKINGGSGI